MQTIVITEEEMHGTAVNQVWEFYRVEKVNRILSPVETMMALANERAGIKDNLLWHGYEYREIAETRERCFIKNN